MFLPVIGQPSKALTDLLICGAPILCHAKSAIKKLLDKQYTLTAGNNSSEYAYNPNHAIDDYANILEMLYYDPSVQKLLKKKADKKYRRKMNSFKKVFTPEQTGTTPVIGMHAV